MQQPRRLYRGVSTCLSVFLLVGCGAAEQSGKPEASGVKAPAATEAPASDPVSETEPSSSDAALNMLEGAPPPPPSEGDASRAGPFDVSIHVEPEPVLSAEAAKTFRLRFRLTNRTGASVSPEWSQTSLRMNGKALSDWAELRAALPTRSLAPNESFQFVYQSSGKAVVPPGVYEFVLSLGGDKTAPVQLMVTEE